MQPTDPHFHRNVLESLPIGVYVVNREGKIVFWNDGAERITGHLRQDVLGRYCEDELLEHTDIDNQLLLGASIPLVETMREGKPKSAQISLKTKAGHFVPVQLNTVPFRDDHGGVQGAVEIFEETTTLSLKDRRRDKLAAYGCLDKMTGVLNHEMIQAHIHESLAMFAQHPVPFCLTCVSIDDLGKIRERFGQGAVDATLNVVAQTLQNGLRPTDFMGRWNAEEFVGLLTECSESEVVKVVERLRKLVHYAGINWWGDTIHVRISVGATSAHDHDTVETMIARAEQGLRESSAHPSNLIVVISKP